MMSNIQAPCPAELVNCTSITPSGAGVVKLADVNGDGRLELLLLQTAGQLQSKVYGTAALARLGVDAEDQALYCLTVIDLAGRVLWRDGQPWDRDYPFTGHGGSAMRALGICGPDDHSQQ